MVRKSVSFEIFFPNKRYVCIIYVFACVYVDVDVHTLWVLNRPAEDPAIFQAIQARCGGNRPVGDMDAPEDLRSVWWLKGWEGCRFGRIWVFLFGRWYLRRTDVKSLKFIHITAGSCCYATAFGIVSLKINSFSPGKKMIHFLFGLNRPIFRSFLQLVYKGG